MIHIRLRHKFALLFGFPLLAAIALAPVPVQAFQSLRPMRIEEWRDDFFADRMIRPKGSVVAWADYVALRRDFPSLTSRSDAQVDAWILEHFNFVSASQSALDGIRQTPIPFETSARPENLRKGYRDENYARAALLEAGDHEGLVDIKGNGHYADSPRLKKQLQLLRTAGNDPEVLDSLRISGHSDGLMSLGEALAETTRQRAIQMRMDMHNVANGTKLQTVESYFVIALPFDILKKRGEAPQRAALYGRQAHLERRMEYPTPREIYDDFHGYRQHDGYGAAVDFGGAVIQDPAVAEFAAFDGALARDPQTSRPWTYAHDTAAARTPGGDIDRVAIERHIEDMTRPFRAAWEQIRDRIPAANDRILAVQRRWLGDSGNPARAAQLLELVPDASSDERRFIRHLLRNDSSEELAETLFRHLGHSPPALASFAAEWFSDTAHPLPVSASALLLESARDPRVQDLDSFKSLIKVRGGSLGDAATDLARMIEQPSPMADRARDLLFAVHPARLPLEARRILSAQLEHPSTRVRNSAAAILELSGHGSPRSRALLLEALGEHTADDDSAIQWLKRLRVASTGLDQALVEALPKATRRHQTELLTSLRNYPRLSDAAYRAMLPLVRDPASPLGDGLYELVERRGRPQGDAIQVLFEALRSRDLPDPARSRLIQLLEPRDTPLEFIRDPRIRDRLIRYLEGPFGEGPGGKSAAAWLRTRYAGDPAVRHALSTQEARLLASARRGRCNAGFAKLPN